MNKKRIISAAIVAVVVITSAISITANNNSKLQTYDSSVQDSSSSEVDFRITSPQELVLAVTDKEDHEHGENCNHQDSFAIDSITDDKSTNSSKASASSIAPVIDFKSDAPTFVVKAKPLSAKVAPKIFINYNKLIVAKGNKFTLISEALNTDNKEISYKVADKKIATVSAKGEVVGKAVGQTKVTAYLTKDKSVKETCVVTVSKRDVKAPSKPKDGDKKVVNGRYYRYDWFNGLNGSPWTEYDPNNQYSKCDACKQLNSKCICGELIEQARKNYKCEICGKGYGDCKCIVENASW